MRDMKLVTCVSPRENFPKQIKVGRKYWIDSNSAYKDSDGDEYVSVFTSEKANNCIGNMLMQHFKLAI